jgi:UDP-N-acetyl-D-glucosamine dehydrogenase
MANTSITVIGLGYVGLPLALNLAKAGFDVTGFDLDSTKIQLLNSRKSYISDIAALEISKIFENHDFKVSEIFTKSSTYIICVPTPLTDSGHSDVSFIKNASKIISENLTSGDLVILESSTYPGTTEELMIPILEENGLKAGKDFFVGYAPERVNPGGKRNYKDVNRVVSGLTPECLQKVYDIYSKICDNVFMSNSIKTAEVSKLLENSYRLVNISLINSLTKYCELIGVSVNDVIEAANTKPFGFSAFYPSIGAGGHCIPIDPIYLSEKMEALNLDTTLIRSAQKTNDEMHIWIRERINKLLINNKKRVKVLFFGVSYKENVNDVRHSYAIELIENLVNDFDVNIFDPLVSQIEVKGNVIKSLQSNEIDVNDYDLLLLNHSVPEIIFDKSINSQLVIFDLQSPPLNLAHNNYFKL